MAWTLAGADEPVHYGTCDDVVLLAAVVKGDPVAFDALYARYYRNVYGAARTTCGAAHADDVTNDVFSKLWNTPHTYDPHRGRLRTYLTMQARGRALEVVRSELARRIREVRALSTGHGNAEEDSMSRLVGDEVRSALLELPTSIRRPIVLAFFYGYSYREVAQQLGEPEGTVKSRIRIGLGRLQKSLTVDSAS